MPGSSDQVSTRLPGVYINGASSVNFSDVLPHLVDAHRRGVLVPFLGSGMSRPACEGWPTFLRKLAIEAGVPLPQSFEDSLRDGKRPGSNELYRLADKAVVALRSQTLAGRA